MIRALVLWCLLALPAQAETLRIGTEADYAPFIFKDEAGALTGYDKALGDAICARTGAACVWLETGFDQLMPGLVAGQFDVVIAGIGANPDRLVFANFTDPYRYNGSNIASFAGLAEGISVEDALIGVQSGTSHEAHLSATFRAIRSYPSNEAALQGLMQREVDLVFGSSSYLQHAFESDFPQLRIVAVEPIITSGAAIAVTKSNPALLDRLNAVLIELRADGTLDTFEARWFVSGEPT